MTVADRRPPRRRAHQRAAASLLAAALVVVPVSLPSDQATADDGPVLEHNRHIAPGLVREAYRWNTLGGQQAVQVLRFRLDDERLDLRVELGKGRIPGREPVDQMLLRLGDTAVAGVNASFFEWSANPDGKPDGLVVRNGHYASEPLTRGHGPRGGFALFANRSYAVARPGYLGQLTLLDDEVVRIRALNRQPCRPHVVVHEHEGEDGEVATTEEVRCEEGELVAFTSIYGPSTATPAGTLEIVVPSFEPSTHVEDRYAVGSRRNTGNSAIAAGSTVLAATGPTAQRLGQAVREGDEVTIAFGLVDADDWYTATQAVAAGPLLLKDGYRTSRHEWFVEGFDHPTHNDRAHARTIVGFTEAGEVLLVTVDGRRTGHSVGLSTDEAITLMRHLGAVDAVMLDGGGSTTMAIDGRIVNRPCCDSTGFRAVSSALVVHSNVPTPDVTRLSGVNRYATAAAIALDGWSAGARTVLLASGANFPDGLAGGSLAAHLDAPLLLTEPTRLPPATWRAIEELGASTVMILGGEAAVAGSIQDWLTRQGIDVHRVAGDTRVATAAEIARRLGAASGRAFLASGWGFADALSATVPAALASAPLLLTAVHELPAETLAALVDLGVREVVVAGGPAAVSQAVADELEAAGFRVVRLHGPDRFTTSAELARWLQTSLDHVPTGVVAASGWDYPDALTGGPYGAKLRMPVLLVDPEDVNRSPASARWLESHDLERAVVLGGRVAVSTWVAHRLQAAVDAS